MADGVNGSSVLTPSQLAMEDAKKQYMERIWSMTHGQLFSELMRVHTESAKLLQSAEAEIARLKALVDDESEQCPAH